MWPDFIEGEHHKIFTKQLEAVAQGKSKDLLLICRLDTQSLSLLVYTFLHG